MRTNEQGMAIIKFYEGILDGLPATPGFDPYLDPIGIPTIGYGSTWGLDADRVTMSHPPITMNEAEFLLSREAKVAELAVMKLIRSELTPNMFSALVSLTYNIGSGNFQSSTLRMKLNRGQYEDAAGEFWKWRRAGGVILRGLVRRRETERALFVA